MQCQCGSNKLLTFCLSNRGYVYSLVNDNWIASDPKIDHFFHSSRSPFQVYCTKCRKHVKNLDKLPNQYSANIDHKEITLDLDGTLFSVEHAFEVEDYDFEYKSSDGYTYYAFKRPHLETFIEACLKRFDKINIFTAAQPWYADELIKTLNIPPNKMGFIKTIKNTRHDRPLINHDSEYIKDMDNTFIIEDRPFVVAGHNNSVYTIPEYHYSMGKKDDELLKAIKYFNNKQKELTLPVLIDGEIDLQLKDITISVKGLPLDTINELLTIPSEDTSNGKFVRMKHSPPSVIIEKSFILSYGDLNYENYSKVLDLVKNNTDHKKIDSIEFESILELKYKRTNRDDF